MPSLHIRQSILFVFSFPITMLYMSSQLDVFTYLVIFVSTCPSHVSTNGIDTASWEIDIGDARGVE